ncbi:MAG: hypothetical protein JWL63_1527 [Rhodocyclales bacterium]|nr:hypothetical protein [Rhodocyclales bacterium]
MTAKADNLAHDAVVCAQRTQFGQSCHSRSCAKTADCWRKPDVRLVPAMCLALGPMHASLRTGLHK